MQIRITKSRAAIAALFVLAGVGLGSLLSPLVGTALATAGQIANISDRSGSAFFAKVDSSGALKTTAAVSGKVAPALPPQPFNVLRGIGSVRDERSWADQRDGRAHGRDVQQFLRQPGTVAQARPIQRSGAERELCLAAQPHACHVQRRFGADRDCQLRDADRPQAACDRGRRVLHAIMARPSGDPNNYVDQLSLGGYVPSGHSRRRLRRHRGRRGWCLDAKKQGRRSRASVGRLEETAAVLRALRQGYFCCASRNTMSL